MPVLIIREIRFLSYLKLSGLLAIPAGLVLALLFLVTNDGRAVNFGPRYFYGAQADLTGFFFVLLSVPIMLLLASLLAYYPARWILRLLGGLKVSGEMEP